MATSKDSIVFANGEFTYKLVVCELTSCLFLSNAERWWNIPTSSSLTPLLLLCSIVRK